MYIVFIFLKKRGEAKIGFSLIKNKFLINLIRIDIYWKFKNECLAGNCDNYWILILILCFINLGSRWLKTRKSCIYILTFKKQTNMVQVNSFSFKFNTRYFFFLITVPWLPTIKKNQNKNTHIRILQQRNVRPPPFPSGGYWIRAAGDNQLSRCVFW